jgi:hypothetical protein
MTGLATPVASAGRSKSWPLRLLLGLTAVFVIRFILKYVVPYLSLDRTAFGNSFWPRATAAAWLCWAVPLLLTEPFLQLEKIRRPGASPSP